MRRRIAYCLLVAWLWPWMAPWIVLGATAFVQECVNEVNSSATSITCTFSPAVGNNALIACFGAAGSLTATGTFTDNGTGNTYTNRANTDDTVGVERGYTAYAKNVQGNPTIVTLTYSASVTPRAIGCHEVSGADTTAPDDGFAGAVQVAHPGDANPDNITSGNISGGTTVNGDYLFATSYDSLRNCISLAAGTGYTGHTLTGCNPPRTEHQIQSTAGTTAGTFSQSGGTTDFITIVQAFKAQAAAAGGGAGVGGGLPTVGAGQ